MEGNLSISSNVMGGEKEEPKAQNLEEPRAFTAAPQLCRLSSVSITAASKSDQDRICAILRRAQSTTSEASASLGTIVATMHAAEHVSKETGQLLGRQFSGLSVKEMDDKLLDVFVQLDVDASNSIDKAEFAQITQMLGMSILPDQVSALFHAVDADGSGTISFEELRQAIQNCVQTPSADGLAEKNASEQLQAVIRRLLQLSRQELLIPSQVLQQFKLPQANSSDEFVQRVRSAVEELASMRRSVSDPSLHPDRASEWNDPQQEAEEATYICELEHEIKRLQERRCSKKAAASPSSFPAAYSAASASLAATANLSAFPAPGRGKLAPGELLKRAGARLREMASSARDLGWQASGDVCEKQPSQSSSKSPGASCQTREVFPVPRSTIPCAADGLVSKGPSRPTPLAADRPGRQRRKVMLSPPRVPSSLTGRAETRLQRAAGLRAKSLSPTRWGESPDITRKPSVVVEASKRQAKLMSASGKEEYGGLFITWPDGASQQGFDCLSDV